MGCACGKRAASSYSSDARAAARGVQYVYDFTPPNGGETMTFGSPIEARTAVRKHGGGVVRRRAQTVAA